MVDKKLINIKDDIKDILSAYDSRLSLKSISDVKSGYLNPVYILSLNNGEDLVLRILNSASANLKAQKEATVYRLLEQNGIPVAKVLKTDITRSIIPYDYVISSKLNGHILGAIYDSLSQEDLNTIYKELGNYLAKIHSITFGQFGDVLLDNNKIIVSAAHELSEASKEINPGPFNTWKDMFLEIIKSRLVCFSNTEFEDLSDKITNYFIKKSSLLEYKVVPRLVHLDLHSGNIFIDNGHVSGIIDVEESLIGHNEYDLMRTELAHFENKNPAFKKTFFDEYTKYIKLDDGYEERKPFYYLSRQLVQAKCLILFKENYSNNLPEDIKKTKSVILNIVNS